MSNVDNFRKYLSNKYADSDVFVKFFQISKNATEYSLSSPEIMSIIKSMIDEGICIATSEGYKFSSIDDIKVNSITVVDTSKQLVENELENTPALETYNEKTNISKINELNNNMSDLSGNENIIDLNLSVRIKNCLHKIGLKTLNELIEYHKNHGIYGIKNLGKKSVIELEDFILGYIEGINELSPFKTDPTKYEHVPKTFFNFTVRTFNCFEKIQIKSVGEIISYKREDLIELKNLGEKSVNEVLDKIKNIDSEIDLSQSITKLSNLFNESNVTIVELLNRKCFSDGNREALLISDESNYGLNSLEINAEKNIELEELLYKAPAELLANGYVSESSLVNLLLEIEKHTDASSVINKIEKTINCEMIDELVELIEKTMPKGTPIKLIFRISSRIKTDSDILLNLYFEGNNAIVFTYEQKCHIAQVILDDADAKRIILSDLSKMVDKHNSMDINIIQAYIAELFIITNKVNYLLERVIEDGYIINSPLGLKMKRASIVEMIDSIENDRDKAVCRSRIIDGRVLSDVANEFGVSRERIRQICKNVLRKITVMLHEDIYIEIFTGYSLSKQQFVELFNEQQHVYMYLNERYKSGDKPFEELRERKDVSLELQQKIDDIMFGSKIVIDGVNISPSKLSIVQHIVRRYKKRVSTQEFMHHYNSVLRNNKVENEKFYFTSPREVEGFVGRLKNVISNRKKSFRYYNINEYDMSELYKGLKLDRFIDIEISAYKLFAENTALMVEFDIDDEYELHNLLKRLCLTNLGYQSLFEDIDIKFGTMPTLLFGDVNRENQFSEFARGLYPATQSDLAIAYEEEYGFSRIVVQSNYFKFIENDYDHVTGKYLGNEKATIPIERLEMIREFGSTLTNDIYMLEDLKRMFVDAYPGEDDGIISKAMWKELGYIVASTYAYSAKYSSATECFESIFRKNDFVNVKDEYSYCGRVILFDQVTSRLMKKLDILEYDQGKYISIKKLESIGITKNNIRETMDEICRLMNNDFFTIHTLRKRGFIGAFDRFGFEDFVYASLSKTIDGMKYRRSHTYIIFRMCEEQITIEDLILDILSKKRRISIYDLIDLINDEYGIEFEKFRIRKILSDSEVFYSDIREKYYINEEDYYKEIDYV